MSERGADGDALLLAAAQLRRPGRLELAEAQTVQQLARPAAGGLGRACRRGAAGAQLRPAR